ncbi:MAG: acyl-CoA desaturase [Polyangia bacterium]
MEPIKIRFPGSSDFFSTLKSRVAAYFEQAQVSSRDSPRMYAKTAVILGWLLASYLGLLLWADTAWQVVLLSISGGLAMAGLGFSVQHDGGHGGYSSRSGINRVMALTLDLIGASSYVWHFKHNIVHHTYTNIAHVDADTDVGFFARLTPNHPRRSFHRYQHLYIWFLYMMLPFKWIFFDDYRDLVTGRIGTQRFPRPSRWGLAGILGMKALYLLWALVIPLCLRPAKGVALAYVVSALTLGLTLSVVFQLAHCLERAEFPVPNADHAMTRDWAVHQVETTVDFAPRSRVLTWFLGGLNYQVEHHLFPRICHVHYPALSQIVKQTCAEHGIRYRAYDTFWEAVAAHARWVYRMGRDTAAAAPETHPSLRSA